MNDQGYADMLRDLEADLAVCDAATDGPWKATYQTARPEAGGFVFQVTTPSGVGRLLMYVDTVERDGLPDRQEAKFRRMEDANFAAEARTGWPVAIRRALMAEGRLAGLLNALAPVLNQEYPNPEPLDHEDDAAVRNRMRECLASIHTKDGLIRQIQGAVRKVMEVPRCEAKTAG